MNLNRLLLTTSFLFFIQITVIAQQSYYVDQQNGQDSYDGLSTATAFQNFDTATSVVQAGDTIAIIGTYLNPSYDANYTYNAPNDAHLWHAENTLQINGLNGNNNAYITIKAYDQNTKILGDGANIVRIMNGSYLRIEGLNIEGEVKRIPLSTALALQFVYIIADNNMTGTPTHPDMSDIHYHNLDEINDNDGIVEETDIYTDISNLPVIRPSYTDTRGLYASNCEHLELINNKIHHTSGGGLRVADSKFVKITENDIYRCSARSYSGTHALVVTKTKPIGSDDSSISIERNLVHHNYNEIFSWSPKKTIITPRIDEGKGISLQRNNTNSWINGQGRILVANNICYWNGFSGVHSNDGYRIDFINNTCFMNSYTNTVTYANDTQMGNNIGISSQRGNDIRMINNISVVDAGWGGFALSAGNSTNLNVRNNLIYGVNGTLAHDSDINDINTIEQDPLFVDAPTNYLDETHMFDFHLQSGSPAINQGLTGSFIPLIDFYNYQRDALPDIGAIEFNTTSISELKEKAWGIYPNPATDKIFVKGLLKDTDYTIFDISGKILEQGQSLHHGISIKKLAQGQYLIKISNQYFKLIKSE